MSRLAILATALVFSVVHAGPFDTTDQNPLLAGFGLHHPFAARLEPSGTTSIAGTLNWSNTAAKQKAASESLLVDAESREWRVSIERALSDTLSVRIEIPYRTLGGGSLDSFVERWHSLFGFPSGDRTSLPRDAYQIDYERSGKAAASYAHGTSGIGDVSFAAGYQLHASLNSASSVWWAVKLPTGDDRQLIGSGAFDTSLSLAHEYAFGQRWKLFAQTNGIYLSRGNLLPEQQRHVVWGGLVGLDYEYSNALTLTAQLDGHTAAFKDSALNLFGDAWILTIGGEYRFNKSWRVQLGLSEDVKVEASPDVNFLLTVAKTWK